MLSCLGQFYWRDLLHEQWQGSLHGLGSSVDLCGLAMCLECDGCKEHDKKSAEGFGCDG